MKRKVSILLVVALVLSIGAMVGAQVALANDCPPITGAIWTTNDAGNKVNQNLYAAKADVYLNGGPAGNGGPGLPPGDYYIKVTAPNGTLLGTSVGAAVETVNVGTDGILPNVHLMSFLKDSNGNPGYDDTGNKGGVYKVWASQDKEFAPSCSKTDNFKVKGIDVIRGSIAGLKYEDINMNGQQDADESPLSDWVIRLLEEDGSLVATTTTGANGSFEFINLELGKYSVCEEQQDGWKQTQPADDGCYEVILTSVDKDVTGLAFGNTRSAKLTIVKFYDYNGNGVWDKTNPLEVELPNWMVMINGDHATTPYEAYVQAGEFVVSECMPIEKSWRATTDTTFEFTLAPGEEKVIAFGNVCVGEGGGKTLGFWSNKNGQAMFGSDDLAAMVALNLRNANGTHFNPGNYAAFRTWLLAANANNMANMLSAQLAAMKLNVHNGLVSGTSLVWTGAGSMTINALIGEADASLGANGLTLDGHAERANQERLKNLLDCANNNKNFIQVTPCPYTFCP